MSLYAGLMVLIYPLGIPALYSVLLFRARGELSIPELRLSKESRSKSFYAHFFGYYARTTLHTKTPEQERWEIVREDHYLSFLIQPYEQRVYWFEVVEVLRRLSLSGVLIVSRSPIVSTSNAQRCPLPTYPPPPPHAPRNSSSEPGPFGRSWLRASSACSRSRHSAFTRRSPTTTTTCWPSWRSTSSSASWSSDSASLR